MRLSECDDEVQQDQKVGPGMPIMGSVMDKKAKSSRFTEHENKVQQLKQQSNTLTFKDL
jgi:hypothetical protein